MNEYKIIINGKVGKIKSYGNFEMAIRSIMNGYNYNTLFIITNGTETKYFKIVKSNVSISGYTDLVELDYNTL